MLYFALPNFFENFYFNGFLHNLNRQRPDMFKTKVSFYSQQGSWPYHSWSGGVNSNVGNGAYYNHFIDMQRQAGQPIRINCANVLLEESDFNDSMSAIMLECMNNGSNTIEISSIPLMEKIADRYPEYRFTFSKQADLITEFTPELLNEIIASDKFLYVGIPDKYTHDLDWLKQIKKKSVCEITVNPICPASCETCDACLLKEHENQLKYYGARHREACKKNLNIFDPKNVISIEEIQKTYVKMGYTHFTFSNTYAVKQEDYWGFLLNYFIKPECLLEAQSMLTGMLQDMMKESQGGVNYA